MKIPVDNIYWLHLPKNITYLLNMILFLGTHVEMGLSISV
jgi:hypothetical protein